MRISRGACRRRHQRSDPGIEERDTVPTLDAGGRQWPGLRLAFPVPSDRCREQANFHSMRHHVVSREPGQKGFVVLPRRWVVAGCTKLPARPLSGWKGSSVSNCGPNLTLPHPS